MQSSFLYGDILLKSRLWINIHHLYYPWEQQKASFYRLWKQQLMRNSTQLEPGAIFIYVDGSIHVSNHADSLSFLSILKNIFLISEIMISCSSYFIYSTQLFTHSNMCLILMFLKYRTGFPSLPSVFFFCIPLPLFLSLLYQSQHLLRLYPLPAPSSLSEMNEIWKLLNANE